MALKQVIRVTGADSTTNSLPSKIFMASPSNVSVSHVCFKFVHLFKSLICMVYVICELVLQLMYCFTACVLYVICVLNVCAMYFPCV